MKKLDINKLILPIAIILGCLILGGFLYKIQVNKQRSIEKQQKIDLVLKEQKDKQNYIDNRRSECLKIYQTEIDKWNNTTGYEYVAEDDICYIAYKANKGEWEGEVCEDIAKGWNYELWGYDSRITRQMFRTSTNCRNNSFEKQF